MVSNILKRLALLGGALAFTGVMMIATATASAGGTQGMDGGFTQTYGWALPMDKVTVHRSSVTTPELRGLGIFGHPEQPLVRTGLIFNGAIPSYQFRYASAEEAAGCSGTQLPGEKFFTISVYSTTFSDDGGVPPVGEIIPVDEGSITSMALVCADNMVGTYSFGLTGDAEIRTGDLNSVDPFGNEYSIIAVDVKNPL